MSPDSVRVNFTGWRSEGLPGVVMRAEWATAGLLTGVLDDNQKILLI